MGQSTPIQPRRRNHVTPMTADEAQARAAELFADAMRMPVGNARTATMKEACDYRMLAEIKRHLGVTVSKKGRETTNER